MEQFLRRQIASEKEEIERLRAEIAEIQRYEKLRIWHFQEYLLKYKLNCFSS